MYELKISGVPMPKCMVCENRIDTLTARDNGWPYLIKPRGWDDRKLVGAVMYHLLEAKFPHINWTKVLGLTKAKVNKVVVHEPDQMTERVTTREHYVPDELESMDGCDDIAHVQDEYIVGTDEEDAPDADATQYHEVNMESFFEDAVDYVDMELIQRMGLLPQFMADITEAIKLNIIGTAWMDGYNKKLGTTVGDFKYGENAPNLVILDVSGSIPRGVSYTMVSIIDMLRTQANADLIITSHESVFFGKDDELPTPEKLSYLVGGCNEAGQFNRILEDKVFGRHWGNVIAFGDMHAPTDGRFREEYQVKDANRRNTIVDRVMCYDTRGDRYTPGYVLWALPHAGTVEHDDGSWMKYMRR